jgi:hypothetical protein
MRPSGTKTSASDRSQKASGPFAKTSWPLFVPLSRRERLEIAIRRRPKGALEHRDEGAGAIVTHFERDRRDRPARCEQPQGVEQPQLLPPPAECHACFLLEESLEGSRAGSHPFRHLLDQTGIFGMRPQPCGRALRPFIGGKGKPQRNRRQYRSSERRAFPQAAMIVIAGKFVAIKRPSDREHLHGKQYWLLRRSR